MMQINKEARERQWSELNQWAWQPTQMMVINFYSLYALFCFSTLYCSEIYEPHAQHSGCFSSLNTILSLYVVFYRWHSMLLICSVLFIGIFFFCGVFSHCGCPHLCACMCVTVVVRSQVVVLVLRGSVAEETQCPYQEAGWTGNPAENTNVMVEIINLTCSLASTVQVQNIPMQKVGGTTSLFWVKNARIPDGCLIRAKQEIQI